METTRRAASAPLEPAELPPTDLGRVPCNKEHLLKMPFFAGGSMANLGAGDLHESYRPAASIHELTLNTRAVKVLEALGIRTVGELLTTPQETLMDQWGFGPATLHAVHGELERLILSREPLRQQAADFSSFSALAASLIRATTIEPRNADILEKRLGVGGGYWSLGKLGNSYGLTRERIRQIETVELRKMSMRAQREAFADFWRAVLEILRNAGQRCDLAHMARQLTARYKWQDCPADHQGFAKLMALNPALRVDGKEETISQW